MGFRWRETIRSGNSTATLKNYYANNLIILMNVQGSFEAGMAITGDLSGTTLVLSNFSIEDKYDLDYDYTGWDELLPIIVTQEDGEFVTLEGHSDATPPQESDSIDMVTI